MTESTTPQRTASVWDEDWNTDEVLSDFDTDEDPDADGPAEPDEPPTDEVPASEEGEPQAEEDADEEDADTLEDGHVADEAAPGESAPPASVAPEETPAVPLTFSVDGEKVAPEGAFRIDGMVVIPEDVFDKKLQANYFGSRRAWQQKELEYKRRLEEKTGAEVQVEVMLERFSALLEDPGELQEFLADFERNAPVLKAQSEAAKARQETENLRRRTEPPPQEITPEVIQGGIRAQVMSALSTYTDFEGVDLDVDSLVADLAQLGEDVLLGTVDQDYPEAGLKKGDRALRLPVILTAMKREADAAKRVQTRFEAKAAQAKRNTAGAPRKVAPPVVGAAGSPTPGRPASAAPKSREEWLKSLEEDD